VPLKRQLHGKICIGELLTFSLPKVKDSLATKMCSLEAVKFQEVRFISYEQTKQEE